MRTIITWEDGCDPARSSGKLPGRSILTASAAPLNGGPNRRGKRFGSGCILSLTAHDHRNRDGTLVLVSRTKSRLILHVVASRIGWPRARDNSSLPRLEPHPITLLVSVIGCGGTKRAVHRIYSTSLGDSIRNLKCSFWDMYERIKA